MSLMAPPAARPTTRPRTAPHQPCPHCGSPCTHGHGSFVRKDGSRQPRRICRACGRTFNQATNTPVHYLKKRNEWHEAAHQMGRAHSLRWMARTVGVHLTTAFRWRHRLLKAKAQEPAPVMTGSVVVGHGFVRYSEKGSRTSYGPGAHVRRLAPLAGPKRFRRFRDGKPSCVIMAASPASIQMAIASQGRPRPDEVVACLRRLLAANAELVARETSQYEEACRLAGLRYRTANTEFSWEHSEVNRLHLSLYGWLAFFRGVATKYLGHYLIWRCLIQRTA